MEKPCCGSGSKKRKGPTKKDKLERERGFTKDCELETKIEKEKCYWYMIQKYK